MTTAAGKYNRRATIQALQPTPDGMGGNQTVWVDFVTIWVCFEPVISKKGVEEKWVAEQLQANTFSVVSSRYQKGIQAEMRAIYQNHIFNIRTVTDVGMKHEELQMVWEELQTVPTG